MDISLLTSGSIAPNNKSIAVVPFLEELYHQLRGNLPNRNLEFILSLPEGGRAVKVSTDAELLRKILTHLISNAFKFTAVGAITFGYTVRPGAIEFFVMDTGIGIDKVQQQSIFEPFRQEDFKSTRGYEGSGLGLAIVKGLVTLLGGAVTLHSKKASQETGVSGGSTIRFTIPYLESEPVMAKEQPARPTTPSETTLSILIAEDDESSFLLLKAMLPKESIRLHYAVNGVEAVALCKQHPEIGLILMDIKMPVMDGLEATRLIREFMLDIPIIALTAYAQTGDEHKMIKAGCNEYLAKPISREALLDLINKLTHDQVKRSNF